MSEIALVSIIVPVYGVESYLQECVDSLLAQTYKSLEIILVDDQSPDRCGKICDYYAQQDPRVKVIHKKNGGAASARNAGLDAATGEYICFVDSDDLVSPNYIQYLLEHLTQENADIAVCGFSQFSKFESQLCEELEPVGKYNRNAYLLQFLKHWTCSLLWNKFYRREVVGDLRMVEGHRIDDEFFTYQVALHANKIVVFDECLYQYRLRASSVMRNVEAHESKIMLDRLEYMQQRYSHIKAQAPELETAFFVDMLDSFTRCWDCCLRFPSIKKRIRTWAKSSFFHIIQAPIPYKKKLVYIYKLFFCAAGNNPLHPQVSNASDDLFA